MLNISVNSALSKSGLIYVKSVCIGRLPRASVAVIAVTLHHYSVQQGMSLYSVAYYRVPRHYHDIASAWIRRRYHQDINYKAGARCTCSYPAFIVCVVWANDSNVFLTLRRYSLSCKRDSSCMLLGTRRLRQLIHRDNNLVLNSAHSRQSRILIVPHFRQVALCHLS